MATEIQKKENCVSWTRVEHSNRLTANYNELQETRRQLRLVKTCYVKTKSPSFSIGTKLYGVWYI